MRPPPLLSLTRIGLVTTQRSLQCPGLDSRRLSALGNRGKLDRAAADFHMALELEPHSLVFLKNRGLCCRNRGKYLEAVADFDEVRQPAACWVGFTIRVHQASYRGRRLTTTLHYVCYSH